MKKIQKHKHCSVRSTRHTLSGFSKYTEHATSRVLLARLDSSVLSLTGSVRMHSNSDNLFYILGIFFSFLSEL